MADSVRLKTLASTAILAGALLCLSGTDASAATACGGLGQRGCCVTEGRYDWSNPGNGACAPPYIEVGGCSGNCLCGGWNWFGVSSSSHCVAPPVHCGYNGERACCVTEPRWTTSNPPDAGCAPGLVEAWGCSGNCLCGGTNPFDFGSITHCVPCGSQAGVRACGGVGGIGGTCTAGLTEVAGICTPCGREGQVVCGGVLGVGGQCDPGFRASFGICRALPRAAEPWCNCSYVTQTAPPDAPVRGFADLHAHQFANLGFGGLVIWGEPYHPLGVNEALRRCDYAYRLNVVDRWGWQVPAFFDQGKPVHGAWGLGDLIGQNTNPLGLGPSLTHGTEGQASFSGWPLWHQTTHQKMYYRWLERAFRGGQRLMVMMAVTNEVFCRGVNRQAGFGCSDMAAVDKQIQAARNLEAFIDAQNGGAGRGWYRIVTTPQQARAVINAGKMAVVLGIEVDSLFGCKPGYCSIDYVRSELARYKAMGVRHLFPVHLFNNDFGGPAVYNSKFNVGNRVATGEYFDVRECSSEGYGFRFQPDVADAFLGFLFFGVEPAPLYGGTAHCNTRGLTPLGEQFMRELMRQKMIIDIDHMSALAVEDSLSLAEQYGYPLVVGHAGFFDIKNGPASEFDRTGSQLRRIRDLGGVVASGIWHTKESVASDCPSSSKSFAAAYRYAVEQMRDSPWGPAVAFGTDINGMVAQPAPRFGGDACARESHAPQANPVSYPFYYDLAGPAWFGKSVTGGRTFDINTDGVAHVGMLPDFIQDLRNVGVSDAELGPLFSSAEAYLRMWERIESISLVTRVAPTLSAPAALEPAMLPVWLRRF